MSSGNRCYHLVSRVAHWAFFLDDEEMEQLREEQRKRHEELYGIPASGLPGEENDDDDDLGEPNLQLDTGDTSADGGDLVNSDESMGSTGGDDLLG